MQTIKRVLFATDFSSTSENARAHAAAMAEAHDAEIHVLHVQIVLGNVYELGDYQSFLDLEQIQGEAAESELAKHTKGMQRVVRRVTTRDVSAADAILRYAEENDVDLIVLGSHARDGLIRVFLGSVANRVVRDASVSVLVAGPDSTINADGYGSILTAVDFSATSLNALKRASNLAHRFKSELIAMHVIDDSLQPPYIKDIVYAEAEEQAMQAIKEVLNATTGNSQATPLVKVGNPHHALYDAARENNVQLIVMGTLGLRGAKRLLLGSVTDRVMRDSPCAVLACREPGIAKGDKE